MAKIFSGEIDQEVHSDFVKFSRGIFQDRYLIEGKKQAEKWSVKTSAEFANFFVKKLLEKSKGNVAVKGIIVTTQNLNDNEIGFKINDRKNYGGIRQLVIDTIVEKNVLLSLMNKYPRAFYALSFSISDSELKIKAKPPKSGKPGTKSKDEDGPKADFCSLKTSDFEIVKDLFFDFPVFKEIKVKHVIEIKEIELPKNAKTPEEMREKAIRKGIVKRFVEIDGKKEVKEKSFVA